MNREIKFRVWDIKRERLVYPKNLELREAWLLFGNGGSPRRCPRADGVLEQFTGLKDSQEIEIYEGDIIQWKEDNTIGSIEWSQGDVAFILHLPDNSGALLNPEYMSHYTVIGNIHENGELL